ncbi:hypothetical protein MBLNU230_g5426t1 [Neophaeotheca triangularis]
MSDTKDLNFLRYRTWGRALAKRRSEDQAAGISGKERDDRLRDEWAALNPTERTKILTLLTTLGILPDPLPNNVDLSGLVNAGLPDLPDNVAALANTAERRLLYPTPLEEWEALTAISGSARSFPLRQRVWQEFVNVLNPIDAEVPPDGLQGSADLANLERDIVASKRFNGDLCLDILQVLQRDAPRDRPDEGLPLVDQLEADFDSPRTPLSLTGLDYWQGSMDASKLGQGGYGTAYLIVRSDSNGNLVDRLVLKDSEYSVEEMTDPRFWQNGDTVNNERPAEPWLHYLTGQCHPDNNNIVPFRGWSTTDFERTEDEVTREYTSVKIFMGFCPHGSLADLIDAHVELVGRLSGAKDEEILEAMIPENFIWSSLQAMTAAACIMRHGRHPGWGESWEQRVVHLDLKPDNFLLDGPRRDGRFPGYANVQVADFGLAINLTEDWITEDFDIIGPGSLHWQAPEQRTYRDAAGDQMPYEYCSEVPNGSAQLKSSADVWAIGLTIMSMMNCITRGDGIYVAPVTFPPEEGFSYRVQADDPTGPEPADFELASTDPPLGFSPLAVAKYSPQLRVLVLKCVEGDPRARPRVDELFEEIQAHVRDEAMNLAMPGFSIEQGGRGPGETLLHRQDNKFVDGSIWDEELVLGELAEGGDEGDLAEEDFLAMDVDEGVEEDEEGEEGDEEVGDEEDSEDMDYDGMDVDEDASDAED